MLSVPPLAGLEDTIRYLLPRIAEIVMAKEVFIRPEKDGQMWTFRNGSVCPVEGKIHKNGVYVPLKKGGWLILVGARKEFNQSILAQYCNQVIENSRRFDEIKGKTIIDPLTGIPNRTALYQRLCEEIERKGNFCVIFLDVNDFKKINDTYGHLVGDDILKKAVAKIKAVLRSYDFLTRYGGDEFVVILPRTSRHDGEQIAERISRQEILLEDGFKVNFSWGMATYPNDGVTPEEILRYADVKMYECKNKIKGAYC